MHTKLTVTHKPTDSALVLPYERIVTQNKNDADVICLYGGVKSIVGIRESNTYNFAR